MSPELVTAVPLPASLIRLQAPRGRNLSVGQVSPGQQRWEGLEAGGWLPALSPARYVTQGHPPFFLPPVNQSSEPELLGS